MVNRALALAIRADEGKKLARVAVMADQIGETRWAAWLRAEAAVRAKMARDAIKKVLV